jgi:hypothetical protein
LPLPLQQLPGGKVRTRTQLLQHFHTASVASSLWFTHVLLLN